jgi:hypothetical protein
MQNIGQSRQARNKIMLLEYESNSGSRAPQSLSAQAQHVLSADQYRSFRWLNEPDNAAQERRFPAAVTAYQRNRLTFGDIKVDAVEDALGAKRDCEVANAKRRYGRFYSRSGTVQYQCVHNFNCL